MKRICKWIIAGCLLLANSATYTACEDIDEVPPRTNSTSNKTYKMPDPVVLSATEQAEIKAIEQEYKEGIQ